MSEREMDRDLERVVNSHTAGDTVCVFAQRHKDRRRNIVSRFCGCLIGAAACLTLYFTGLLVGWVSIPAFTFFICICSFCVGRFVEMNRR
jgi:hypothetical protein